MRLILVALLFLTLLCSQNVSEKLIVSGNKEIKETQIQLMKLKRLFTENEQIRKLQKIDQLNLEIETLGDYSMVVIRPIRTLSVKNELLLFLRPGFPGIFSIKDHPREMKSFDKKKKRMRKVPSAVPTKTDLFQQVKIWIKEIGMQWIALLLLSVIGLVLSISSRRKMSSLEKIQDDLSLKQAQMENEIKNLGATSV